MHSRSLVRLGCLVALVASATPAVAQNAGDVWFPTSVLSGGELVRVDRGGVLHKYAGILAKSIAYDAQGRVYAVDPDHAEIAIVTTAGKVGSIPWVDAQSIVSCPDGSFWVRSAASAGAVTFTRIDAGGAVLAGPVLVTAAVMTEVVDAAGSVWITGIFDTTNLIRITSDGTLTPLLVPFVTPGLAALRLTTASDGSIFIANGTTTVRRFDSNLQLLSSFTAPAPINVISPGRAKSLVAFSHAASTVFALGANGAVLRTVTLPWGGSPLFSISSVWEAPDGSFWVDGTKGFFQFVGEQFDVHGQLMASYAGLGGGVAHGDVTGRMRLEMSPSSADPDLDGATNRVELVVGSNPLDAASVPAALTATSSGTSSGGSIAIQIHAPASANQPYFVALSLNGRGGVKLDPPYATPSVPLGQDPLLTLSLRAPPMRPTLGGVLDANGDASSVTSFGPVLSGRTVYVSAIYATPSDVPAATAQVAVTMP